MRNDGAAGMPDAWNVYLAIADAKATTAPAEAAGGPVYVPADGGRRPSARWP